MFYESEMMKLCFLFRLIAIGASAGTVLAVLCTIIGLATADNAPDNVIHSSPEWKNFFLGFGAILYSFGGASIFPTIQHDMVEPKKFPIAVILAYLGKCLCRKDSKSKSVAVHQGCQIYPF